ncbi:MAG: D-arabinono-1,4-lactone oxidase [Gammaproteobacteria bacterium]|nr:D-arabinono-1,4-lactone oxidase [Gammaproteobacteria bacterium]
MSLSRRRFIELALAAAGAAAAGPLRAGTAAPTPWYNWSGALSSVPRRRIAPADEAELLQWLRGSSGPLRPVGSGHSFAPLVPTDGDLLVLARHAGLRGVDRTGRRARVAAGTRLSDLGPLLEAEDQACPNMPDIDRQTLAGTLATATHGTGDFRAQHGYVSALRLATPAGEMLELDRSDERFGAALVSAGALGIVTEAELENRAPVRLEAHDFPEPLETVLAEWDDRVAAHRHFEFFPIPHCDHVFSLAIDETDAPIHNPPPTPEEEAELYDALRLLMRTPLVARRMVANRIVESLEPTRAVDTSYRILCNLRNQRFNEMEYSIPADRGMDCVRAVMDRISDGIDIAFPLEVRYIAGDDAWLSMFEVVRRVSISIHDFADRDPGPASVPSSRSCWRTEAGRTGARCTSLGREQLSALYPRFDDFRRLRAELDPAGRLLNDHLRSLFVG